MSEPVVYTLKHPVDIRNAQTGEVLQTLTVLNLRRLRGADMRKMRGEGGDALMVMLGLSADLPPSHVDMLDAEDATDAGAIVAGFLGGFLPSGGASLPK